MTFPSGWHSPVFTVDMVGTDNDPYRHDRGQPCVPGTLTPLDTYHSGWLACLLEPGAAADTDPHVDDELGDELGDGH